jgi:multiple sugar transport system substrate-binding protein
MLKRTIVLVTLVVLVLAGTNVLVPGAAAQDQIKLRLWAHQQATFNDPLQALIDAYTAEHPNVTIEMETFEYNLYLQTLQTAMPAGDEADIIELFGSWTCSYADRLAPMPEAAAASFDRETFFKATLDGYICDDALYGLPFEFNMEYGAVLVNKAMFEAAGLNYPPAWTSWDELVSDAKALTQVKDGQMTVAGFHFTNQDAIAFMFLAGILQHGGDFWNEDHTAFNFDTEEARATLEFMKQLVDDGVVDPVLFNDSANWSGSAFFTSQAAIALIGSWATALVVDYPDFGEFDYVPLPSFGDTPVFAADSGWGLVTSKNSKYSDAAWDFIQFATANADNALMFNTASGTIPALRELVDKEEYKAQLLEANPALDAVLPQLAYGTYIGEMPDRDLVFYSIIYPNVLDMLQGVQSVDDALAFIDEDANATFEE